MHPVNGISYQAETAVLVEEFRTVLLASGLAARRPVDDDERMAAMLRNANLLMTARRDGVLVGIARSLTDFSFSCYLSDLAVSQAEQGNGIGARLVEETRRHLGPTVNVILSAVPEAVGFYESIKMARLPDCFWYRRER